MYDVYLPLLDKYIYHIHYVQNISKNLCGKLRHDDFYSKLGNISLIRNHAKLLSDNFNFEIQFKSFGNGRSLSNEGCMIEVIDQDLNGNM